MKRTTLAAVFGNIVSLAAVALVHFGIELTAEQQAEIVSALLVIVNTVALIVPAVIATVNKRRERRVREGGFVTLSLLQGIALATIMGLILTACTVVPETPRQAVAASYLSIESLAQTAEIAYRDGLIDDARRDAVREELQLALESTALAQQAVEAGQDPSSRLEQAHAILSALKNRLEIEVQRDE